ncbi:MAG: hypothetical protein ABJP45_02085 [Cyclobacteriaceae bacterium]
MTVTELHQQNVKFQKGAVQLSELIPSGALTEATSVIIRSSQLLHSFLEKLIHAANETQLGNAIERVEDNMDEIVFMLDQLDIANKKQPISLIEDFLKEGYDLMSVYSVCVNQVINQKVPSEE